MAGMEYIWLVTQNSPKYFKVMSFRRCLNTDNSNTHYKVDWRCLFVTQHYDFVLMQCKQRKFCLPLEEMLVNLSFVLSWSVQLLCLKPLWLELHPYWSKTTPRREWRSKDLVCTSGWDSNPSASQGEIGLQYT